MRNSSGPRIFLLRDQGGRNGFRRLSQNQRENLLRAGDDGLCLVLLQKFSAAKAPVDADAVKTGILRSLHVDFGVADVDGLLLVCGSEIAECLFGHVGSRLSADAVHFSDGEVEHSGEQIVYELLHGDVRLVGDDGRLYTGGAELLQNLKDSGVGTGFDVAVRCIVGSINFLDFLHLGSVDGVCDGVVCGSDLFEIGKRCSCFSCKGADDGNGDAASEELADIILCIGVRVTCCLQCVVHGVSEVSQGVEYGSVHIKNCSGIVHVFSFLLTEGPNFVPKRV